MRSKDELQASSRSPNAVSGLKSVEHQVAMWTSYKYRIYPTPKQAALLDEQLRLCRMLYNMALDQRIWAWQSQKKTIGWFEQKRQLTEMKTAFPEFSAVHVHVLQNTLRRLDRAYGRFFVGGGFPRFKSRERFRTLQFNNTGFALLENNRLQISKVGKIKIKLSRPIRGTVKTLSVTRNAVDQWHVSFCCEIDAPAVPARPVEIEVGIDVGIEKLLTASDGSMAPNPRHGRKNAGALVKRQQQLAVKKQGSNNRKRAKHKVAAAYLKVANQRRDHHFKLANYLVTTYDRIYHEALSISSMVRTAKGTVEEPGINVAKKAGLNRSILDAAWGQFFDILRFKAERAGVVVVPVNPCGTSQTCSCCGARVKKLLDERMHRCECGLVLDRDWNAAINILRLGQSRVEAS